MKSFAEIKNRYYSEGAAVFQKDLREMVENILDNTTAKKGFRYLCADICMDLKEFSLAIQILKHQESYGGLSDVGYNNLGYCYWELEKYESAYTAYRKSLELNPDNTSSLRGAAYCSIETQRDDEAVRLNKQLYEIFDTEEAALWYVTALHNVGKQEEVRMILKNRKERFGLEVRLDSF